MRKFEVALASLLLLICALAGSPRAQAQGLDAINIVNGTKSAIPIAVVPFGKETAGVAPPTDIAEVVHMDLARSGKFRTLDKVGS